MGRKLFTIWILLFVPLSPAAAISEAQKQLQLEQQFELLRLAKSQSEAVRHENAIWKLWIQHPDPEATRRMEDAINHRRAYEFAEALDVLDALARDHPEWAEVYNQRATVQFHRQEYESSLADVYQALKREPRHFGSLAGRGVIRILQGKQALGYQSILQAMELHPFLKEGDFLPASLLLKRETERFEGTSNNP